VYTDKDVDTRKGQERNVNEHQARKIENTEQVFMGENEILINERKVPMPMMISYELV